MNYIREELLRQQELLVVLLTGRTVHTPSEELETAERESRTEAAPASEWESWISAGMETADDGARREKAAALAARAFLRTAGENAREWDALQASRRLPSVYRSISQETDLQTAAGRQSAAAGQVQAGEIALALGGMDPTARSMGMAGLPVGTAEAGEVRLVTELRQAESGEPSDAAALSRAFQRDARRYDGGFRLY